MSVEEKVGQLFMPVLYGTGPGTVSGENQARYGAQTPAKVVARYHLGGVILFPANIQGVGQVRHLTNGLQQASKGVPLLIGTDQENGLVSRMGALMTDFPGASVIGSTKDTAIARSVARATGEELRAVGVNLDFAPVADVNIDPRNPVIGKRAFGDQPGEVAKMVAASVKGFNEAGRRRHGQALPRPRRHPRQPHRAAGDQAHAASSGTGSTRRRSRPPSPPGSTPS